MKINCIFYIPFILLICSCMDGKLFLQKKIENIAFTANLSGYRALFNHVEIDTIRILQCFPASSCGSRASATYALAVNLKSDTVQYIELCGKKLYQTATLYEFRNNDSISINPGNFEVQLANNERKISLNYKIYLGQLFELHN